MADDSNVAVDQQAQCDHANSSGDSSVKDMASRDIISLSQLISDHASPYYLHYGDNTGMQIISIILTEDNYLTWSRAGIMALSVKNKEGFIDGTISKPNKEDPLFSTWRRCNNVVSSWIINSIPKELYPSVMHKDSVREVWIELRDRYSQGNGTRIYELKKQIASISQENGSVSSYFNRFKGLWEELDNYKPDINSNCYKQEFQVMQFLMGLDDQFSAVRSQVLLMDPLPSLNKEFALILQDEKHKDVTAKRQQHFEATTLAGKMISGSSGNQRYNSYNSFQRKDKHMC